MATTAVQVVRVYNNRGKLINTSKHLVGVFNDAKVAYKDKKAELKAARSDSQARKGKASRSPSPPMLPQRTSTVPADMLYAQQNRPQMDSRGYTDGFYANDPMLASSSRPTATMSTHPPPYSAAVPAYVTNEFQRPRSSDDLYALRPTPQPYYSNHTYDNLYEELPPPLPARPTTTTSPPDLLTTKFSALQSLLLEANAVTTSARTIVKSLESDPQKMAAVALSLGEISNLLRTMAPGALLSMKGAFPAVVALLISSEFLIAVGVAAGVTVVALGGYKVVKRIRAKRTAGKEARLLELGRAGAGEGDVEVVGEDVEGGDGEVDVEHIQQWRRGISDEDARSLGTSVEEELVTPGAARMLAEGQQQQQQRQGLLAEGTESRLPWVRTPSPNPEKQRSSTPFKNLFKRGA